MGRSYEQQTAKQIELTADSLLRAARHFTSALQEMQAAKMPSAFIEWSKKHSQSLALLAESAKAAATMIEGQIVSFRRGEPSFYEQQAEKTRKETERKRERREAARLAAEAETPKVGRPKGSRK